MRPSTTSTRRLRANATCRALVELYLKRIETYDKSGPSLNAVQTVNRMGAGSRPTGCGVQVLWTVGRASLHSCLVKDQVETSDMPTTYGSAVFKDFVPQRDATVVTRLRNAGAVIIGKSTMGEYAAGYLSSRVGTHSGTAYDPKRSRERLLRWNWFGVSANFATDRHWRGHRRFDTRPGGCEQSGGLETDRAAREPARNVAGAGRPPTR